MKHTSQITTLRIGVSLVLAIAIVQGICGCNNSRWTSEKINVSKQTGASIIQALAAYNAKYGTYPASLDKLVPEQLADIQSPVAGERQWHYEISKDGHWYHLSFTDGAKHPATYGWTSRSTEWGYDSGE
jgi:hypothetical protein